MRWFLALAILPTLLVAPVALAGTAPATPAALSALEPGQWELRSRDPGQAPLHLCVKDVQSLIQLRHPGQSCTNFIVEDKPGHATVSYSCPRTGHGLTAFRIETPRLVQIDAQGVADGYPFALNMEGRRTGVCGAVAAQK